MRDTVDTEIISIVDSTIEKIQQDKRSNPLILGTPYTLNNKLYQNKLEALGAGCVIPNQNDVNLVFDIIKGVLKGTDKATLGNRLDMIIKKYKGVDSIVLACTELPLLAKFVETELPIYDTLQILAMKLYSSSL